VEKEKAAKDAKDEKEDKQKNPKEKAPKKVWLAAPVLFMYFLFLIGVYSWKSDFLFLNV
jgi:cell division septal protein FtsQ